MAPSFFISRGKYFPLSAMVRGIGASVGAATDVDGSEITAKPRITFTNMGFPLEIHELADRINYTAFRKIGEISATSLRLEIKPAAMP